jgi:hypothetical protein
MVGLRDGFDISKEGMHDQGILKDKSGVTKGSCSNDSHDDDDESVDFSIFVHVQGIEHTLRELQFLFHADDDDAKPRRDTPHQPPTSISMPSSMGSLSGHCKRSQDLPASPAPSVDKLISPTSTNTSLRDDDGEGGGDHHPASGRCHSYQCSTMTTVDDDRATIGRAMRHTNETGPSRGNESNNRLGCSSSHVDDEKESTGSEDGFPQSDMERDHLIFIGGACNDTDIHHDAFFAKGDHFLDDHDDGTETREDRDSHCRNRPTTSSAPRRDHPVLVNYDADEDKTIGKKPDSISEAETKEESLSTNPIAKQHPHDGIGKPMARALEQAVPCTINHNPNCRISPSAPAKHCRDKVEGHQPASKRDRATRSSETTPASRGGPASKLPYSKITTTGSDESSAWFGFNESHPKVLPLHVNRRSQDALYKTCYHEEDDNGDDETDEENDLLREAMLSFDQHVVRSVVEHVSSTDWDEEEGTLMGGRPARIEEAAGLEYILADLQKLIVTTSYPFQRCAALVAFDDISDFEGDEEPVIHPVNEAEESGATKPLDFEGLLGKVSSMFLPRYPTTPRGGGQIEYQEEVQQQPFSPVEQQFEEFTDQQQIVVQLEHYDTDVDGHVCIDTPMPRAMLHSVLGFVGFNSECPDGDGNASDERDICCGSRRNRNDLVVVSSIEDLGESSKPEDAGAKNRKNVECGGPCNARREGGRSDDEEGGGVPTTVLESRPERQGAVDDEWLGKKRPASPNQFTMEESEIVMALVDKSVISLTAEKGEGETKDGMDDEEIEILFARSKDFDAILPLSGLDDSKENHTSFEESEGGFNTETHHNKDVRDPIESKEEPLLKFGLCEHENYESNDESSHSILHHEEKEIQLAQWVASPRECPWESDDFSIDYPEDGDLSNDSLCIPSPPTVSAFEQQDCRADFLVVSHATPKTLDHDLSVPLLCSVSVDPSSEALPSFGDSFSSSVDSVLDPSNRWTTDVGKIHMSSTVPRNLIPSPKALLDSPESGSAPTDIISSVKIRDINPSPQDNLSSPKQKFVLGPPSPRNIKAIRPSSRITSSRMLMSTFAANGSLQLKNKGTMATKGCSDSTAPLSLLSPPSSITSNKSSHKATTEEQRCHDSFRGPSFSSADQENCAPSRSKQQQLGPASRPKEGELASLNFGELASLNFGTAVEHIRASIPNTYKDREGSSHSVGTHFMSRHNCAAVCGAGNVPVEATSESDKNHSFLSVWHDLCEDNCDLNKDSTKAMREVKSILRKEGAASRIYRVRWDESKKSKAKDDVRKSVRHRNNNNKIKCPLDAMIEQISSVQDMGQDTHQGLFSVPGKQPTLFSGQPILLYHQGYMC